MKSAYIILVFICLFFAFACNRTSKEITQQEKNTEKTIPPKAEYKTKPLAPEKFDRFYQKFHNDSIFQVSRIKFPLQGYTIDSTGRHNAWKKENWVMHKIIVNHIDTSQFTVEKDLTSTTYKEKIYIEGGGFSATRIFKMFDGKWFLTSYIDEDL